MRTSQRIISIFLILSLLFALPDIRKFTTSYLLRSFYIPLLKAEACVLDFLRIREERNALTRQLFVLKNQVETDKLLSFLGDSTVKTTAIPVAYSPLGIPTKISLDRGKEAGIEYGDVVTQMGYLAGKITESAPGYSCFTTLLSKDMKVGVVDTRSGVLGVLRGGQKSALLYIPEWADIKPGDTLVTSGLGGVFPRGIAVGTISRISPPCDPFYKNISVKLFADYSYISSFTIIKNEKH